MTKKRPNRENSGQEPWDPEMRRPEVVPPEEMEGVRGNEADRKPPSRRGSLFIGTLNVITGPIGGLVDPVRKICYEPLQAHYERKYRRPHPQHHGKVFILDLALLFILGGLAVTAIFIKTLLPAIVPPEIVSLSVQRPGLSVSGQLSDFRVAYRNEGGHPLADTSITVAMPDSFVPEDPNEGWDGTSRTFRIGTVPASGQGEVSVRGRIYAPVGSRQVAAVSMGFWRAGDTEPQRVARNEAWLTEDSLFRLSIRPEDDIVRGRQTTVVLAYGNVDEREMRATVRLTPPDDFTVTGSRPAQSSANEWDLGRLDPGLKGNIEVYGFFRSGSAKPAVPSFTAQAFVRDGESRRLIQEIRQDIRALAGGFEMEQSVDEPAASSAIGPGDPIRATIRYRNSGKETLSDIAIRIDADPDLLEGNPVTAWTPDSVPELGSLPPGASGQVSFEGRLKDSIPATPEGRVLRVRAEADYLIGDDRTRPAKAETSTAVLSVSTRLTARAAAFYRMPDGEQVGSGPLPPQAGTETRYRVLVQIGNALNRVEDAVLEAFLPDGAEWTGRYSVTLGRPPAFLPAERRLVWNIGELPIDEIQSGVGASFEIALTPAEGAAETPVPLMSNLKVCGRDAFTGVRVCSNAESVTNEVKSAD